MIDFVRLNGRNVSAKSLSISIAGVPYGGITALDYEDKLEIEPVYALGQEPEGSTDGKYSVPQWTMTMLKDVFQLKFLPQMALLSTAAGAPGSVGEGLFPITTQHRAIGLPPIVDVLQETRYLGGKDAYAEGINAAVVVCTFFSRKLLRNGLSLTNPLRQVV